MNLVSCGFWGGARAHGTSHYRGGRNRWSASLSKSPHFRAVHSERAAVHLIWNDKKMLALVAATTATATASLEAHHHFRADIKACQHACFVASAGGGGGGGFLAHACHASTNGTV